MHGDALDRAIEAVAADMTASPASSSVRPAVRRRIEASPAGVPLMQWAAAVAAVAVLAIGAWMWARTAPTGRTVAGGASRAATTAPPASRSQRADVLLSQSPGEASAVDTGRQPATAVPAATALARVASRSESTVPAADGAAAEEDAIPALLVDRLTVTALQPATVALDAVPLPMPLRIDQMDVEPLALP